ncbi:MAG: SLC26A/SulP transporter family protein [Myxococcales bacterium]|nr:SLC26A/SulP transporter family protein [Myxococcales bacterium]
MTSNAAPREAPRSGLVGDIWGGLASTLVALPASIAFGIAVFTPVGQGPGVGALAGLLGAVALGTIAPILGGTPRLVSAPCAPAVAVMSAFAIQAAHRYPGDPARLLLQMTLVGLLAAALQLALGLARAGTIIKYIPYPVVTGYLSGVGVVIFLKQLPALLGLPKGITLGHGVFDPHHWSKPSLVVGFATIGAMVAAPKITKAIPPAIIGLLGGILAYVALSFVVPSMRVLAGNELVIGPLAGGGASFFAGLAARLKSFGGLHFVDLVQVVGPATTLAVVLSLDTLKTCVVVDAVTGSRHDSNRELFGQGVANAVSAAIGGMPGAGTSGATLVNVASGGTTRWSAVIEGGAVLFAYLALAKVVAWAPLAALAGILVVVAFKMFDFAAFAWAKRSSTAFDFAVVLAVITVAVGVDLITASAVGVALSILLFIRNESKAPVIRRKLYGNQVFSKRRRLPADMAILTEHGGETVVVELQGSLFFGTTDQLRNELQEDLGTRRTVIFDLRRVDALDLTAAHILEQMQTQLNDRGAKAVFCNLPRFLAGYADVPAYLREVGVIDADEPHAIFDQLSDALAWAEDRLLAEKGSSEASAEGELDIVDLEMFSGRKKETVAELRAAVEVRRVAANARVFAKGDHGDEIFFIRSGTVRISLPIEGKGLHIASFGRGDFFGEIAFLDGASRTADAFAECDTELFVLSRKAFDAVAGAHPRLGQSVFNGLARALALRLRRADGELSTLEEA